MVFDVVFIYRQMRNRDSAMRSRERKKVYVRELEVKSKYLEGECKRLEYALRCCVMENQILYQRLQNKDKAFGVSSAKQESAVLPLGTKLIISFWFWLRFETGRFFWARDNLNVDLSRYSNPPKPQESKLTAIPKFIRVLLVCLVLNSWKS